MTVDAAEETPPPSALRADAETALRTLAGICLAGALAGIAVGGVGGRLAMMLLARLNPYATGVKSDDGFIIGHLTLSGTLSLIVVCLFLGVLGALVYAVVRSLRSGPRWFQLLSISVGPAVVVGGILVHTDGVDFTTLEPALLAVALFVLIPGVYSLVLTLLAEGWVGHSGWCQRVRLRYAALPLLVFAPGFFLLILLVPLVMLWFALRKVRTTPRGAAILDHPAGAWVARGGLTAIFIISAVGLAGDVADLT